MKKYQIQFKRKDSGFYRYFEADINPEEKAVETANDELDKERERYINMTSFDRVFYSPKKSIKTLTVVEYDTEKKAPKRGGYRFKLHLGFIEAKYNDGSKNRNEWYYYQK